MGALIYSQSRPIDGDEGFYSTAIHLAAQGQIPHRDFFSTQTPLQPYLYAPFERLAGRSLTRLRLVSVALLGVTFALLLGWARRRLTPKAALLASVVLLSSSGLVSWNVVVKTHAGVNAFMALGLVLLWRGASRDRRGPLVAAGVAFGLATGVRLFGVVPWGAFGLVCLACAWRGSLREASRRALVPLAGGFACGILPTLALGLFRPDATFFGVWRYHQLRSVYPSFLDRLRALGGVALVLVREQPHLVLLFALALWGVARLRHRWPELPPGERLFWLGAGAITLSYLAAISTPYPIYPQYFTATMPIFLFPFAALACADLVQRRWVAGLVVVLAVGLALCGPGEADRFSRSPRWSLESYQATCREVARLTPPGARVVAFWPGHAYGAGVEYYPDAVNDFSLFVAPKVSPEEVERFHLFGPEELIASLSGPKRAKVVVASHLPPGFKGATTPEQVARLKAAVRRGYRLASTRDGVRILVRNDLPQEN